MIYDGACHCKEVALTVEAPEHIECYECNCSICTLTGYLHLIVPKQQFNLVRGQDTLTTYSFNTHVAQHYFCSTCGIKPFYVPRSNPDGVSINVRCLFPQPASLTVLEFDGVNWEDNAESVSHLST